MDIFLIIVSVIIILFLAKISGNLNWIKASLDEIENMTVMSDGQRRKYSLKIDDPDEYHEYLMAESYREQEKEKKKKQANGEI